MNHMAGSSVFAELRKRVWMPGDDPLAHPLWADQVALEEDMMRAGAHDYLARAVKAQKQHQMTRLKPYRSLIDQWLPDMVRGIQDYIRDSTAHFRAVGGTLPLSVERLRQVDHHLAAYITLRQVVDNVLANVSVPTIASRIGRAIEDEARMRAWEDRDPDLFRAVSRGLDAQHATPVHRRRVNINRFNKLMREQLAWKDWDESTIQHVGFALIGALVRCCDDFELQEELGDPRKGTALRKTHKRLRLKPEAVEALTKSIDFEQIHSPQYQPTLIPPKRWERMRVGGYYTDYVRPPALIRFKAYDPDQRRGAEDEYDSLAMPKVYGALHALQEVAWRVNPLVLPVVRECWARDLGIAGLPVRSATPLRRVRGKPDPNDRETWKEWTKTDAGKRWLKSDAGTRWRREAAMTWQRNAKRNFEAKRAADTIRLAEKFAEHSFYFPHMLDFRGRMYPIPLYLQPQGDDLARGLLTFAHGKEVTEESGGGMWLAIHLANCWGVDKVSFDERRDWVYERQELWDRIAADPMTHMEWADADSPWQALAAIFEWVAFQRHGYGYVSALPIRVDGTCNGIQHFAAMMRDSAEGAAVNLVPGDRPRDIYKEVAERLAERLKAILATGAKGSASAEWWLELLGHDIPRGLTKRPVMILPYGGTREAYFQYTRQWLIENHPEVLPKDSDPDRGERWKEIAGHIAALVGPMREIVHEVASSSVAVMKWLQDCAKMVAKGNQPIFWKTPAGFVVRHFYGKLRAKRIKTRIDGQEYKFTVFVPTDELDVAEQLMGIPPNFVHSLDASALMETIDLAAKAGIVAMTSIHDNFGAPAADMETAYACIRQAFVTTHEGGVRQTSGDRLSVLAEYRRACQWVYAGHIAEVEHEDLTAALIRADHNLPALLPVGDLDVRQVLDSDYFFA